jgi:hypothetical protein
MGAPSLTLLRQYLHQRTVTCVHSLASNIPHAKVPVASKCIAGIVLQRS